jgi:hypothetical protein
LCNAVGATAAVSIAALAVAGAGPALGSGADVDDGAAVVVDGVAAIVDVDGADAAPSRVVTPPANAASDNVRLAVVGAGVAVARPVMRSICAITARASGGRCAGSRASSACTRALTSTGTSTRLPSTGASLVAWATRRAPGATASKGETPASISNRITPRA